MKIKYDKEVDVLYIRFSDEPIEESDMEEKSGVILDFSRAGEIVGLEILNASKKVKQPTKFEYEVA